MSNVSTENLYLCTLSIVIDTTNKNNYKYIFAYKEKDNEGRTIFYDVIDKKYYRPFSYKFNNEKDYCVIDKLKLSIKKQNVKLIEIKKLMEYFDIFNKKIDEVCDNKKYVIKKSNV